MDTSFQLVGLDPAPFAPLFTLPNTELRRLGARRVTATTDPGFPCRISLEDARVGDELLLLPFAHQAADSPYRASGPIFVRRGVARRTLGVNELSDYVTRRIISLRAYDAEHLIHEADVVHGPDLEARIRQQFMASVVAYIHAHNAKHGCFFCRIDRARS